MMRNPCFLPLHYSIIKPYSPKSITFGDLIHRKPLLLVNTEEITIERTIKLRFLP